MPASPAIVSRLDNPKPTGDGVLGLQAAHASAPGPEAGFRGFLVHKMSLNSSSFQTIHRAHAAAAGDTLGTAGNTSSRPTRHTRPATVVNDGELDRDLVDAAQALLAESAQRTHEVQEGGQAAAQQGDAEPIFRNEHLQQWRDLATRWHERLAQMDGDGPALQQRHARLKRVAAATVLFNAESVCLQAVIKAATPAHGLARLWQIFSKETPIGLTSAEAQSLWRQARSAMEAALTDFQGDVPADKRDRGQDGHDGQQGGSNSDREAGRSTDPETTRRHPPLGEPGLGVAQSTAQRVRQASAGADGTSPADAEGAAQLQGAARQEVLGYVMQRRQLAANVDPNQVMQQVLQEATRVLSSRLLDFAQRQNVNNELSKAISQELTRARAHLRKEISAAPSVEEKDKDESTIILNPPFGSHEFADPSVAHLGDGSLSIPGKQLLDSQSLQHYIAQLEDKLSGIGADSQQVGLTMQMLAQQQQREFAMLSNWSKNWHETIMQMLRKIGA